MEIERFGILCLVNTTQIVRIEDSWKWRLKDYNHPLPPAELCQNWRLLKMEIERWCMLDNIPWRSQSELKTPENGDWKTSDGIQAGWSNKVRIEDSWKWRLKDTRIFVIECHLTRQNWRLLKMEIESLITFFKSFISITSELKTPENGDWKLNYFFQIFHFHHVRIEDSWKWRLKDNSKHFVN